MISRHQQFTRANLKQKQPFYYDYLVRLFGFNPDHVPSASALPASAQTPPATARGGPER
jgi:hypothetical protein